MHSLLIGNECMKLGEVGRTIPKCNKHMVKDMPGRYKISMVRMF